MKSCTCNECVDYADVYRKERERKALAELRADYEWELRKDREEEARTDGGSDESRR